MDGIHAIGQVENVPDIDAKEGTVPSKYVRHTYEDAGPENVEKKSEKEETSQE